MKSSHKTDTHYYFIIQQLTLNKPFKCDCTGRKKNHGFSTFQKWQIWPNFTIVKTQLVHRISVWNKNCIEAYPLLLFVLKYFWRHSKCTPSRDQNLKGILTPGKRVQQASFDAWNINPFKHKLLRHLNPSQSCNGFRLYFGVSVRFNMIPFNWFLR